MASLAWFAVAAGAPNPACRLGESAVGPGDEVGPAAFDAGVGVGLVEELTHKVLPTCRRRSLRLQHWGN